MKILNLLVICFLIVSCQVRHDYKITGNVQGIPDSTVIDLYVQYENLGSRVSSDTIVNGEFSFSDSIGDEVLNMNLSMRDMQKYSGMCNLWVGKADINVNGSGKYLSAWETISDLKEQKDENNILNLTTKYRIQRDSLNLQQMRNYEKNINDNGVIRKQLDSLYKIQQNIELDFLKDNYNSKVYVMHLCRIAEYCDSVQKLKIKSFYQKIDTTYMNSLWGEGIKNSFIKKTPPKAGDKFVDFKSFDLNNNSHQLSEYLGKYILMDFWSIGCYPCILSIPELHKLSIEYKDELTIVGLNMETKKKFWIEQSKKDSVSWVNLSDGKGTFGGASFLYGINGFPTYILISPEGIIVERWMGYRQGLIDEKLSKYIDKKKK